eukprot:CAMPEP_0194026486 /NCGR_PEP_ID=MMETSP0009_2-20130614/775_1 /TAXON_ID=210454 /ORGANISM="Grammatophora oceanica, Strain CCMP 410" /LENGTH=284 /DNA_ID=CAMNT_0038665179 /DNA_START=9 /DNA_END=863 /DNA_ORIENTATION=+
MTICATRPFLVAFFAVATIAPVEGFVARTPQRWATTTTTSSRDTPLYSILDEIEAAEKGEQESETPAPVTRIMGCRINQVKGSLTEWEVEIDGSEAELGSFSKVIYQKILSDAKKEKYVGFKIGTVPPYLLPVYKAYAMEECAREATLEALEQHDIRPFESSREEMKFEQFWLEPAPVKKQKKKKRRKKKKRTYDDDEEESSTPQSKVIDVVVEKPEDEEVEEEEKQEEPQWRLFANEKDAVDGGWSPGKTFSFRVVGVRGQMKSTNTDDAKALSRPNSFIPSS